MKRSRTQEFCLVEVGLTLHLVGHGLDGAPLEDISDLLGVEVGDADALDQPQGHELLHGEPGVGGVDGLVEFHGAVLVLGEGYLAPLEGVGPVDQVEVEILEAEVGQSATTRSLHILGVVLVVPELAGDEDLLPGHARGPDTLADLLKNEVSLMQVKWRAHHKF